MASREIPRVVDWRPLHPAEVTEITRTVFAPAQPQASDLLLVFGAPHGTGRWAPAAALFHAGLCPRVLVTGGVSPDADVPLPEAPEIAEALVAQGVPRSALLLEDRSTNTLENVLFSRDILQAHGLRPRSILYYCKAHHSGRVGRTLRRHLPQVALSCASYEAVHDGVAVSAHDWHVQPPATQRVLAEYERIRLYAARGDIA